MFKPKCDLKKGRSLLQSTHMDEPRERERESASGPIRASLGFRHRERAKKWERGQITVALCEWGRGEREREGAYLPDCLFFFKSRFWNQPTKGTLPHEKGTRSSRRFSRDAARRAPPRARTGSRRSTCPNSTCAFKKRKEELRLKKSASLEDFAKGVDAGRSGPAVRDATVVTFVLQHLRRHLPKAHATLWKKEKDTQKIKTPPRAVVGRGAYRESHARLGRKGETKKIILETPRRARSWAYRTSCAASATCDVKFEFYLLFLLNT